jgi:hypothetical protein
MSDASHQHTGKRVNNDFEDMIEVNREELVLSLSRYLEDCVKQTVLPDRGILTKYLTHLRPHFSTEKELSNQIYQCALSAPGNHPKPTYVNSFYQRIAEVGRSNKNHNFDEQKEIRDSSLQEIDVVTSNQNIDLASLFVDQKSQQNNTALYYVGVTILVLANIYAIAFIFLSLSVLFDFGGVLLGFFLLPLTYVLLPLYTILVTGDPIPLILIWGGNFLGFWLYSKGEKPK